jgi:hypothetical protein
LRHSTKYGNWRGPISGTSGNSIPVPEYQSWGGYRKKDTGLEEKSVKFENNSKIYMRYII